MGRWCLLKRIWEDDAYQKEFRKVKTCHWILLAQELAFLYNCKSEGLWTCLILQLNLNQGSWPFYHFVDSVSFPYIFPQLQFPIYQKMYIVIKPAGIYKFACCELACLRRLRGWRWGWQGCRTLGSKFCIKVKVCGAYMFKTALNVNFRRPLQRLKGAQWGKIYLPLILAYGSELAPGC